MKEYKEKEKDPDLVPIEMIDQALSDFKKEQEDDVEIRKAGFAASWEET